MAILKLTVLEEIAELGYFLLSLSPILLAIGIARFLYVKKQIKKYYMVRT